MSSHQTAEHIHSQLSHPVIDSDGHWIEFEPAAMDYLHAGRRRAVWSSAIQQGCQPVWQ